MIRDARDLGDGTAVDADVCVVGAGPAGITLARSLSGRGLRIAVLESGGLAYGEATQDLYRGALTGHPYHDLAATRLRYLGGSSNHWQGWCRPLEPIDLEPREATGSGGWPLAYDELLPFYERAQEVCELGAFRYRADDWGEAVAGARLPLDERRVVSGVFQFSPPTRFGERYRTDLDAATDVDLLLHANAVDIAPDGGGVQAATLQGAALRVRASTVIVACGGIENARHLLSARGGRGVGGDAVGRYFTEHPHAAVGAVLLPDDDALPALYSRPVAAGGTTVLGTLLVADAIVRAEGLRRASFTLDPWAGADWVEAGDLDRMARLMGRVGAPAESRPRTLYVRSEQAPNPDSRILLGDERDALGARRVVLDWRLQDDDVASIERSVDVVAGELGATGLGRVFKRIPPAGAATITGGHHHMGTTRMGTDTATSVVDAQCRVHGHDGLYVAGGSVFATGGVANPTLTIVALALRLAEHLASELGAA